MIRDVFKNPTTIARYKNGPYAESREKFLKKARDDGKSPSTIRCIAWALRVVAEAVDLRDGTITLKEFEDALSRRIRRKSKVTSAKSKLSLKVLRGVGKAWLRSAGALPPVAIRSFPFSIELNIYSSYMRDERGLSVTTIVNRRKHLRWFFSCLGPDIHSLGDVTLDHIDSFVEAAAHRGWTRRSLHQLGDSLRMFFRYAAQRGWCTNSLAQGIDLPSVYMLEDVPRAPAFEDVRRVLDGTSNRIEPLEIRDHAILSLFVHYGLRLGELVRLTLDDLDWVTDKLHLVRPKVGLTQRYPLSAPVGEAILRYLKHVRPHCSHRALFLTIKPPFRPLSGNTISTMVKARLKAQGVKLNRCGAHCLRHACAGQLLDARFTLKQIADHLGHRNLNTTRIYTKIDLPGLREVAELDLGGLL